MTYSYQLDEEVFVIPGEPGPGYSIRWTIPLETQVLGARENGEIRFTPMGTGTLITYNNATEPFGYNHLKALLPSQFLRRIYHGLGGIASDYYQRTVNGFLKVANELSPHEIQADIAEMRALLEEEGFPRR